MGQNFTNYKVRLYDKNLDLQIDSFFIYKTDTHLVISYNNINIRLGVSHLLKDIKDRHPNHVYLDIFIDTILNPNDCWQFYLKTKQQYGESGYSNDDYLNCIKPTNYHVVRCLDHLDENPKNQYHYSDFFIDDGSLFIGAISGLAYSGLTIGGVIKYDKGLLQCFNVEASIVATGEYKNG